MYQFSWSQSNHLVDSHCSWHCWYLLRHFLHCILDILTLHKEQFHCCVCLGQQLVCIRDITALRHHHVSCSFQGSSNAIRCSFAVTSLKKIPRASLEPPSVQFCAEKEEVASLFLLSTGSITKKVQHRHFWMSGLRVIQHGIEVLPYCWGAFMSAGGDGAEAHSVWFSANIQDPYMQSGLLV